MARFYGAVGYGITEETAPGVYELVITEKKYYGDLRRNIRRLTEGESLNKDLAINNMVSIVADPYAELHFHEIRYVEYQKTKWEVTNVEVLRPRLNLRLGGVYNGPTPTPTQPPEGDDG